MYRFSKKDNTYVRTEKRSVIMGEMESLENEENVDGMNKSLFYSFLILAFVIAFGLGTWMGYEIKGRQVVLEEEPVQAQSATTAYKFYLSDDEGLVTVYRTSNQEIYEYTNIVIETLPKQLQKEIQQKKYMVDEEELYNFLESYTS